MFSSLINRRIIAVATTLLGLGACSKANDATPAPDSPTSSVTWTVDGTVADATATASLIGTSPIGILAYSANGQGTRSVELSIPGRVGTFAIAGPERASARYSYQDNGTITNAAYYPATAGSITVSSYTASAALGESVVVGTFNFTGRNAAANADTKTISNGSFTVRF